MAGLLGGDEPVQAHRVVSVAKKAAAFFRISRSSRKTLFSRRRRASSARSSLVEARSPPLVDLGLLDPAAHRRLGEIELVADLRDRLPRALDQLNGPRLELLREPAPSLRRSMWTSLEGHHRPSVGVRRSGATPLRRGENAAALGERVVGLDYRGRRRERPLETLPRQRRQAEAVLEVADLAVKRGVHRPARPHVAEVASTSARAGGPPARRRRAKPPPSVTPARAPTIRGCL